MPKKTTTKILNTEGWLTKKDAADRMFTSEKSVERWAAEGKITAGWRPVPKRRPVRVYNPDDVERIREEQKAGLVPVVESSDGTALAQRRKPDSGLLEPFEAAISRLLDTMIPLLPPAPLVDAKGKTPMVPIADKPLLTLAEAQALTGLSRGILREAIDAGTLTASLIGRTWRIRRAELDRYLSTI